MVQQPKRTSFRLFKTCRYLNLANNLNIDDHCLTKLHWIDESLEYLDLSGTNVTLKGLGTGISNSYWMSPSIALDITFLTDIARWYKNEALPKSDDFR